MKEQKQLDPEVFKIKAEQVRNLKNEQEYIIARLRHLTNDHYIFEVDEQATFLARELKGMDPMLNKIADMLEKYAERLDTYANRYNGEVYASPNLMR